MVSQAGMASYIVCLFNLDPILTVLDLKNIRVHLEMLRNTNQPKPSLRDTLAFCLEQNIQGLQTPSPSTMIDPLNLPDLGSDLDYSWQIFNQASLEQVAFNVWPVSTELQPPM